MPNSVAVFAALDELVPPQALLALSKVIVAISDLVAFAQAQDTMSRIGHLIVFGFVYAIYRLITHEWVPQAKGTMSSRSRATVAPRTLQLGQRLTAWCIARYRLSNTWTLWSSPHFAAETFGSYV